jgi:2-polyprenyl-6-methoxyphenol hydroxylase-like FAD-dependent oxidoreductase
MAFFDQGSRTPVLVSGAGIAGAALAYWLRRAGFRPVLVESAPAPRTGGYMIDFWGPGFEVVERMGLAPRLREVGYFIQELRLVDAHGNAKVRLPMKAFAGMLGDRYVSLLRSDLAGELLACVPTDVEIRFGDEIIGLAERDDGVDVQFRRGPPQRFGLVVGADGAHSKVRRLAFAGAEAAVTPLGSYVAAFTSSDYAPRDEPAYVSRTVPGRQAARCSLRDGRTTVFLFVADTVATGRRLDTRDRQRAFLAEAFAGIGWECDQIVRALWLAEDLYFDAVAQVRLPAWSSGRIGLVGDAAWAPSLLAGEGSSFAVAGAMVLAGELGAHPGDYRAAFDGYERRLRRYIEKKQRAALRMRGWFAPRTAAGLAIRDQLTRLAALPGLSHLLVGPMAGDDFVLPNYAWPD